MGLQHSSYHNGGSVLSLSQSRDMLITPWLLQWPVRFPTDSCIAKLRSQKFNLNSILLPQIIGPLCSCGTLWQCLSAQLHSVSTEISNNVCWLAVRPSGVVSYCCWHFSPQRSTRCSKLPVVLRESWGRFHSFICLRIYSFLQWVVILCLLYYEIQ